MSNVVKFDTTEEQNPLQETVCAAAQRRRALKNVSYRVSAIAKIRRRLERDRSNWEPIVGEANRFAAIASLAAAENMLLRGAGDDCDRFAKYVEDIIKSR
jgi:hypothetical protein